MSILELNERFIEFFKKMMRINPNYLRRFIICFNGYACICDRTHLNIQRGNLGISLINWNFTTKNDFLLRNWPQINYLNYLSTKLTNSNVLDVSYLCRQWLPSPSSVLVREQAVSDRLYQVCTQIPLLI